MNTKLNIPKPNGAIRTLYGCARAQVFKNNSVAQRNRNAWANFKNKFQVSKSCTLFVDNGFHEDRGVHNLRGIRGSVGTNVFIWSKEAKFWSANAALFTERGG